MNFVTPMVLPVGGYIQVSSRLGARGPEGGGNKETTLGYIPPYRHTALYGRVAQQQTSSSRTYNHVRQAIANTNGLLLECTKRHYNFIYPAKNKTLNSPMGGRAPEGEVRRRVQRFVLGASTKLPVLLRSKTRTQWRTAKNRTLTCHDE